jgi:superfamily I DNA/RNA helicase
VVTVPETEAGAALGVVEQIKRDATAFEEGPERNDFYGDNAVLCRTNSELNAYESACIIRGVPYSKKGAASFFNSPETRTVLGYVQLVTGDDNEKMQKALGAVINKPNRFFVNDEAAQKAVDEAISDYARVHKIRISEVNPMVALREVEFRNILLQKLMPTTRPGDFRFDKSMDDLNEMVYRLDEMQANTSLENFKTTDLFDSILGLSGRQSKVDPNTGRTEWVDVTIRESITASKRDSSGNEGDEDESDDTQQLGNVAFLYELAKPDPTDPGDVESDPSRPGGFRSKMSRYAARARVLNVEMIKDEEERKKKERQAVYLGTVHSVKGDQWGTTYVALPAGKFPLIPRPKPGEPPMSEEEMTKKLESERRLGYVALTRAKKNLIVVCPKKVGGREAGVSPFVHEANLKLGENVVRPGVATPPDTQLPVPEVKQAANLEFD